MMAILWLSASFGYYLISYQLKYIEGDLYLNGIISGVSEDIAYILAGFIYPFLGFKKTMFVSFLISIVGMTALTLVNPDDPESKPSNTVIATMVLGAKFGISSAFNLVYLGNNLLFPVSIKATSYGICNFVSRLFTVGAPFFAELKPISISEFTFIGFCVLSVIATFCIRQPL